jgi:Domain of unknown function (DUF5753)/Helix-turn-helix domain
VSQSAEPGEERVPVPPHVEGGVTIARMVLGAELRRLREDSGVSAQTAGAHIRASHAKISRMELGRVGFKAQDITDLLTLYGVTDEQQRAAYQTLVDRANERGWWSQESDIIANWFEMYLRLEQEAQIIRSYEVQFIHGLLQSEDYARSVIRTRFATDPVYEVDRRVNLRLNRQKILEQPGGPKLWAITDEAALTRPIGSRAVMRGQLEHLLDLADKPNVVIQLLPFQAGGHAAGGGPFTVLRFAIPELPDIVYLEQLNSAVYIDKRFEVEEYLWIMERLTVQAETPARTRTRLRELLAEI